jgi:hypothetical protein
MEPTFFAEHTMLIVLLAWAVGVYAGMTLMACLTAASQADDVLEREAALAGTCCSHDCNQGRDCPVRVHG